MKNMNKTKKIGIIALVAILIIGVGGASYFYFSNDDTSNKDKLKQSEVAKKVTKTVAIEIKENAGDKFVVTKDDQFIVSGISADTVTEFKIASLVTEDGKVVRYVNEDGKASPIKDLGLQEVKITEDTIQDVESGEVVIEPETKVDESGNVVASKPIGGNTSGNASGNTNNGNTGSTSGSGSSSNKPSSGGSGSTSGNTGGGSGGNTGGNTGGSSSGGGTTVTPPPAKPVTPIKHGYTIFGCSNSSYNKSSGNIYNTFTEAQSASIAYSSSIPWDVTCTGYAYTER